MARRLSMAFLAAILIAALIRSSTAQTTHVVGDTTGWTIPASNPSLYSTWAANQKFAVGDILVFNFLNNQHNVAKVSKADYDACTTINPISLATTTPARITINATGEHYFICNITGHCSIGQKLMINVSAATSAPAPQPSSASTPAPQPSSPTTPAPQPARTPSPVSAPSPGSSTTPPPPTTRSSPPPSGTIAPTPPPPTNPSAPSPSGAIAPPPPNSSARSLGVAGLSVTFFSIVVAFLY